MNNKQFINELRENEQVESPFLIKEKNLLNFRSIKGKYLHVLLGDRSGEMEGRMWDNAIHYDHRSRSYRLVKQEDYFFTEEETLALAKILLDSRAFNINEINQILNKLLLHIDPSQRSCLKKAILNESYHYIRLT